MDWIAAILCAIGVVLVAHKCIWGWLVGTISNILWLWVGIENNLGGLAAIEVFLIGCNLFGWWKWEGWPARSKHCQLVQ